MDSQMLRPGESKVQHCSATSARWRVAAACAVAATVLVGCLDIREEVTADGSVLGGSFSYRLTVPPDLVELEPDSETPLDRCKLPSAGDPPRGASREDLEMAELARRLALRKTREERIGETLHCAYTFRTDLANWTPEPYFPLLSHVTHTEHPRRGWWIHLFPEDLPSLSGMPDWLVDALLADIRIESTIHGDGIVADGYTQVRAGVWRWKGTMAEAMRARPRYWVPGH